MKYVTFDREEFPELLKDSIGCAVVESWAPYVRSMLTRLEDMRADGCDVRVIQIKEKFGDLRVYIRTNDTSIDKTRQTAIMDIISETVTACQNICAMCDSIDDVRLGNR